MIDNVLLRVQMQAGYAGKPVLRDIRFELKHGEVLGLVGTSGAGKSTLVQSLLGLLPWRGGQVTVARSVKQLCGAWLYDMIIMSDFLRLAIYAAGSSARHTIA